MSKIKTRETVKDVKTIDKAAIAGERMKNAFIRSKDGTENLMDDRQVTPSEYAEDKVLYAAEDISHDAAYLTGSRIKTAANKGKEAFQCQRIEKAAERQQERDLTSEQPTSEQSPTAEAKKEPPIGQSPSFENQIDGAAEQTNATGTDWTLNPQFHPGDQPVSAGSSDTTLYSDTDRMVEQSWELSKEKAKQKAEVSKQLKQQADKNAHQSEGVLKTADATTCTRRNGTPIWTTAQPVQSIGTPVQNMKAPVRGAEQFAGATRQSSRVTQKSVRSVEESARTIKQTAKSAGRATAKGTIKTSQRTVKTLQQPSKAAIKTTQAAAKTVEKTAQTTMKVARAASAAAKAMAKAAAATAKTVAKAVAAAGKAIIAESKALIAAIAAGGWVAVLVIFIICLIAMVVGSCFGIFSNEDTGSDQTIYEVVQEINADYNNQLEIIKQSYVYDDLEMSGSRAVWKEVLSVYAVKTTTDPSNAQEVASMDNGKKALLEEVFWAMNVISARTETFPDIVDDNGDIVQEQTTVTKTVLYITVSHKTAEEMAMEYGFTAAQREQLTSLLAEENDSLWAAVLYDIFQFEEECTKARATNRQPWLEILFIIYTNLQ